MIDPDGKRLEDGQRATDDMLLRIVYRDGTSVIEYASRGRARYMLERYTRAAMIDNPSLPGYVEEVRA